MKDELLKLRQQGLTIKEIATTIGKKPKHIEYLLNKYGLITANVRHSINIGEMFGCWEIIDEAPYKTVSGRRYKRWIVVCINCNIKREVYTCNLIHDARRSNCHNCGLRERGETGLNVLYAKYKRRAIEDNIEFYLTREQFNSATSENCFYCGREPLDICGSHSNGKLKYYSAWGDYTYNGIDRINSNLGYITCNCVPCCKVCNWMKSNMTITNWFNHIKRIISNEQEIIKKLEQVGYTGG